MVLPLLGSFLGSALLPGMFSAGALSPLAAGAIGSGLGSLLQGDDLDEAIGTGLTSFMGGKLLGGLGKEFAKGDGGITDLINPKMAKGVPDAISSTNIADAIRGGGLKGGQTALSGALKGGLELAKQNPFTTTGLVGGAMLADAANQRQEDPAKTTFRPRETVPIQQNIARPMPGYRPGIDPEFNYGFRNPSATELETRFIQEGGIANMHYSISNTAEYGDYLSGPKVITETTKEAMREILDNIQSGNFADEFLDDCRQSNDGSGGPFMKSNRKSTKNHPIEEVGRELRSKMKFLNSEKLVDIEKN